MRNRWNYKQWNIHVFPSIINHDMTLFRVATGSVISKFFKRKRKRSDSVLWQKPLYPQKTRHVFVKHGCPRRQQSQNMAKISKSYILTPPTPRGMGCQWSVRNPWMNLKSKFGYCMTTQTLNVALCLQAGRNYGQTDKWTDRQTDGQTDDPITRCPLWPFRPGGGA